MRSRSSPILAAAACAAALSVPDVSLAVSPALKAALDCQKSVTVQGRNYAKKRQTYLLGCIDKLLKCEVLLEVDGANPNKCRDTAIASCTAKIGSAATTPLSKAAVAFDTKAATGCLTQGLAGMLSTGSGGLWFNNDLTCNGEPDVPSLAICLRERIEQEVDTMVGDTMPRAGMLLDNAGFAGEFSNIPRPPTTTVTVSATGPASGTLVALGNINLPLGNALKIDGDMATLPCGGGANNGKLTITVGSGPTAVVLTLKESYGPAKFALFGPYTASGSIPYSIELKDGSCDDTISGNVVIP